MKNFRFIDLFSGLGGFRIALQSLGGECLLSCDIDRYVRETYKLNFGAYPYGDISKIPIKNIPNHDILCAGFPCQPFSIAGKRLGFEDARGTLFFEILKIVHARKPKVLFLENVSGIVNHNSGNTLRVILDLVAGLGYSVTWKTMNTLDYGIPQNRNRWYCIAIRNDILRGNPFKFPDKCNLNFTLNDIIYNNVNPIYNISDISKKNILLHMDNFKNTKKYNKDNILIANEIRPSRCHFRCDGISPCLTAKMGTGGNNIPVVVNSFRKFTEVECLKLMGFPNWYEVPHSMQSYKQIGNSVVIPIIKKIASNILKIL